MLRDDLNADARHFLSHWKTNVSVKRKMNFRRLVDKQQESHYIFDRFWAFFLTPEARCLINEVV